MKTAEDKKKHKKDELAAMKLGNHGNVQEFVHSIIIKTRQLKLRGVVFTDFDRAYQVLRGVRGNEHLREKAEQLLRSPDLRYSDVVAAIREESIRKGIWCSTPVDPVTNNVANNAETKKKD